MIQTSCFVIDDNDYILTSVYGFGLYDIYYMLDSNESEIEVGYYKLDGYEDYVDTHLKSTSNDNDDDEIITLKDIYEIYENINRFLGL